MIKKPGLIESLQLKSLRANYQRVGALVPKLMIKLTDLFLKKEITSSSEYALKIEGEIILIYKVMLAIFKLRLDGKQVIGMRGRRIMGISSGISEELSTIFGKLIKRLKLCFLQNRPRDQDNPIIAMSLRSAEAFASAMGQVPDLSNIDAFKNSYENRILYCPGQIMSEIKSILKSIDNNDDFQYYDQFTPSLCAIHFSWYLYFGKLTHYQLMSSTLYRGGPTSILNTAEGHYEVKGVSDSHSDIESKVGLMGGTVGDKGFIINEGVLVGSHSQMITSHMIASSLEAGYVPDNAELTSRPFLLQEIVRNSSSNNWDGALIKNNVVTTQLLRLVHVVEAVCIHMTSSFVMMEPNGLEEYYQASTDYFSKICKSTIGNATTDIHIGRMANSRETINNMNDEQAASFLFELCLMEGVFDQNEHANNTNAGGI